MNAILSSCCDVKNVINLDPTRPIVESTLVWSDELANKKFDNLLALIYQNPVYSNEMFKGGVTKIDVERMREEAKVHAREKKTKKPYLAKKRKQRNPKHQTLLQMLMRPILPQWFSTS